MVLATCETLELEPQPEQGEDLELLKSTAQRMAVLCRRLVRPPGLRDVWSCIDDVVISARPLFQSILPSGVELALRLDASCAMVPIDEMELERVIMNLVKNAREALPRTGRLEIATRMNTERDRVTMSITDTGCGMTPDVLARMFEPHFSTKDTSSHTRGLGMFSVQSIAQRVGGIVVVTSEVGRGTCVEITLPMHPRREA